MRTRLVTGAVVAASAALLAGQSLAAPSAIDITSIDVGGREAHVSGNAWFTPTSGAQSVGGTNTQFSSAEVADAAGINLTGAAIEALANGTGLRFIWNTTGLPAQVPPEGVRYTWSFKIGETQYQLQAKRTNLASITTAEDPVNHAKQVGKDFFQLRGACVTNYVGPPAPQSTAGCYHLAFLSGGFDAAGKRVYMDLPYETRDQIGRVVAPDFKRGATLVENQTAGMSITGAFQAVIGNTTTSDYINGWTPYTAGETVGLATGADGDEAESLAYAAATLTQPRGASVDGAREYGFTGIAEVVDGADTLFVRSCQATTCLYSSFPLS